MLVLMYLGIVYLVSMLTLKIFYLHFTWNVFQSHLQISPLSSSSSSWQISDCTVSLYAVCLVTPTFLLLIGLHGVKPFGTRFVCIHVRCCFHLVDFRQIPLLTEFLCPMKCFQCFRVSFFLQMYFLSQVQYPRR